MVAEESALPLPETYTCGKRHREVSSFCSIGTILPFSNRGHERKRFFPAFLSSLFAAFFCSTAPQAFFRPDRRFRTPARAEAVKVGRRSAIEAYSDLSRPRLDSFEHGGRLDD